MSRRPRILAVAAAVAAAATAGPVADARAGEFTHVICAHPETRVGTGLTGVEGLAEDGAGAGWEITRSCPTGLMDSFSGMVLRKASVRGGSAAAGSWRGWRLRVDRPGLRLARATLWRAVSSSASTTGEIRWASPPPQP